MTAPSGISPHISRTSASWVDARIIGRCFQGDFVENLGANQVISTSKSGFLEIEDQLRS